MSKPVNNPLLQALQNTFHELTTNDLQKYLNSISDIKKWSCYSDYCFGDKTKPNDVVCFTIVPYVDDFEELSKTIKSIANRDIKNTKIVKEEFINFLTNYPLINFSFILNDKKKLFGNDSITIRKSLEQTFLLLKEQYRNWAENEPERKDDYNKIEKKIDCTILNIRQNKKVKQIIEMVLVTFLGAYVSSIIVNKTKAEIFGWFSDRDSINEVCNNLSIDLFHNYLHGLTYGIDFQFASSLATSQHAPFYDELLKIPDYIAGTLADYNMENNSISKDKFDTMLTEYMGDNVDNNFIHIIDGNLNPIKCSRVNIFKK